MPDFEGDAVFTSPKGPKVLTTKGYVASKGPIDRQGGLGLPSFNAKPNLPEVKDLTGEDHRISLALGYDKVNTKD